MLRVVVELNVIASIMHFDPVLLSPSDNKTTSIRLQHALTSPS